MKERNIVLILLAFLFVSCIEDFHIVPGVEKHQLVAICILNEGLTQNLKMYYLSPNGEDSSKPVGNVKAWLFCQDTTVSFRRVGDLDWQCEYQPYYGQSFELKILPVDSDTIRAVTFFPKDFDVVCNQSVLHFRDYYYKNPYTMEIEYKDSIEVQFQTYELVENRNSGKPITWSNNIWVFPVATAKELPGQYLATDHVGVDDFNIVPGTISDCPYFNLDYLQNASFMIRRNLFVPLYFPNLKLHYKCLRICHPESFSNNIPNIRYDPLNRITYSTHYNNSSFILLTDTTLFNDYSSVPMYVYSVSNDYDRYLAKTYKKLLDSGNIITELYDQDASYSNIHGGIGIFGACIARPVPVMTGVDYGGQVYYPDPYLFMND